jgi:hypothetical protein
MPQDIVHPQISAKVLASIATNLDTYARAIQAMQVEALRLVFAREQPRN